MIDNDPKHVEAAYQAAMHKSDQRLAKKVEKLEEENRELKERIERNSRMHQEAEVLMAEEIDRLRADVVE